MGVVSALMFGLVGSVQAGQRHGTRDPGVNARQHHQHKLVKKGVRSGQLTGEETRELHQEQKQIRIEERAYKSDGDLTFAERKDLHQDLNEARRNIYQEKHDDDVRPKAQP
jgi:polyhydroxyalkanoate synthesis regulator phasin